MERYREVIPRWSRFVEASSRPEPTHLRVSGGPDVQERRLAALRSDGFELEPHPYVQGVHRVVREPVPVSKTLGHWLGDFYIQQASTGLAAPALGPARADRVLDLCAAPGGKTTHLAELAPRGTVVASDVDGKRLRALLANVYRMRRTNVLVMEADGCGFPGGASFDRVLVDAPCSAEGGLRRGSGRTARSTPEFRRRITSVQEGLLERALRLVRPGGVVLYATCTFAPEENEAVVDRVLDRLEGRLEPIALDVPHAPGLTRFEGARFRPEMERAWRIYPHHLDSGGLFMARIRKGGKDGTDRAPSESGADGWTPLPPEIPSVFPPAGEGDRGPGTSRGHADEADGTGDRAERFRAGLAERFGLEGALDGYAWTERGDSIWLSASSAWPGDAWRDSGGWRLHAVGLRAAKADPRTPYGERPTSDLLRFLDGEIRSGAIDVDASSLLPLLENRRIAMDPDMSEWKRMVAVRHRGRVLGRGWLTEGVLVNEISKGRSLRLARFLKEGTRS